jgi:protein subunit release factor A
MTDEDKVKKIRTRNFMSGLITLNRIFETLQDILSSIQDLASQISELRRDMNARGLLNDSLNVEGGEEEEGGF